MFRDETMTIGINEEVAREFGVQTATIYNRIGWLNAQNEDATAESVLAGFPFLTINQVKNSLRTLEKAGEVAVLQPNRSKMDPTKHYFAGGAENGQS